MDDYPNKEGKNIRNETIRLLNKSPKTRLSAALKRIGKLAEAEKTYGFQAVTDDEGNETSIPIKVEDNRTRLDANKFLIQLHDALPKDKVQHSGEITVNYNMEPIDKDG